MDRDKPMLLSRLGIGLCNSNGVLSLKDTKETQLDCGFHVSGLCNHQGCKTMLKYKKTIIIIGLFLSKQLLETDFAYKEK